MIASCKVKLEQYGNTFKIGYILCILCLLVVDTSKKMDETKRPRGKDKDKEKKKVKKEKKKKKEKEKDEKG